MCFGLLLFFEGVLVCCVLVLPVFLTYSLQWFFGRFESLFGVL